MYHRNGFAKVRPATALFAAFLLLAAGAGRAAEQLPADAETVVGGNTAFALDLYAQLAKAEKGNLFFSPGSIHTALAMTYAGARGQTAAQMAKALHYSELDADKLSAAYGPLLARLNTPRKDYDGTLAYELVVANALWGQKGYPFKPEFLALNKKYYAAGLEELDFAQSEAARKTINDWVAQQTREKIKDLIPQGIITNLTRLVLTNAVYFKSNWAEKFQKAFTKDGPFKIPGAQPVQAPLMLRQGHYGYLETPDFQALEMPYRCHDLSMVVLLPRKDDGLPTVEQALTPESLAAVMGKLANESVRVTFPKFKIECRFSLPQALKALGMTDAFVFKKADFTGMTTAEDLYISDVIHKSYVAVDEEGTEAAAATAVVMRTGSAMRPQEPKVFTADHPFLFLIRHRATGLVLFLGRVVEPVAK